MPSNRLLRFTFTISLLTHGLILLPSPNLNPFSPAPKKQGIKVRYIKEDPHIQSLSRVSPKAGRQSFLSNSDPFLKLNSKAIAGNRAAAPPPYIEQGYIEQGKGSGPLPGRLEEDGWQPNSQNHKPLEIPKPTFASSELIAIKRKIALPPIEMARIDNPSYISYYQIVREKIRRSAYQNYTHNQTGEVYISFIISNDGFIKDVRLIEEKTKAFDYLKSISLKSVKGASPFPNFPKELDYPQLSFNIIISFEIE